MSACAFVIQGNGGTEAPSTEEGLEDIVGGMYVRFDAPKAKIRKSWPGVRGTLCSNLRAPTT